MSGFEISMESLVMTSTYITHERFPVLQVNHQHDEEDGDDWQFHCGNGDYSMDKMQLVRLSTILGFDPDLIVVSDLPVGMVAIRKSSVHPWVYLPNPVAHDAVSFR